MACYRPFTVLLNIMKEGKYSSPYALVREPLESTKVYDLLNAKNKLTEEIWHARVFHHEAIVSLDLQDHVEYNEEVLDNLKEKAHVVYLQEVFLRGADTYLIQEKHDLRLSRYLELKGRLPSRQVEAILRDLFEAVCDIYEEQYVHRNIRSEHLVRVEGEGEPSWKIESLVLDNREFPIDTPFTWKRETASPEDLAQREALSEDQLDAQVVWNFGYLAIQMLLGQESVRQITREGDLSWVKIKEVTRESPQLFELVEACFRFKFRERAGLRKFFDLGLFADLVRPGTFENFVTASKIFKESTASRIQKSVNMKSRSMKKSLQSKLPKKESGHDYFSKIEEVEEEIYDEAEKDITRFRFLLQAKQHLSQLSRPEAQLLQHRAVIDLFYSKLALKFEERIRRAKRTEVIDGLRREGQSRIQSHSRIIKGKGKQNELVTQHSLDLAKDYSHSQLIAIFNKLNGYAYSLMRTICEKEEGEAQQRALAYFGLLAFLVNMHDWSPLEVEKGASQGNYWEVFEAGSVPNLLRLSQKLVRHYFQTQ